MGSLNGTLVNYRSVAATHAPNAPIRQRGNPVGLVNGDIVTLGSTSQVLVPPLFTLHVTSLSRRVSEGVLLDFNA